MIKPERMAMLRERPISASALKTALKSFTLYYQERFTDAPRKESSPAMQLGKDIHYMLLEREKFDRKYHVFDGSRRTKAFKEFMASLDEGDEVRTQEEMTKLFLILDRVHKCESIKAKIDRSEKEKELRWDDPGTALPCVGRLDLEDEEYIRDIKTIANLEDEFIGLSAMRDRWDIQAAFYQRAVYALHGIKKKFEFILIETVAPYRIRAVELGNSEATHGHETVLDMMNKMVSFWQEPYATQIGPYGWPRVEKSVAQFPSWYWRKN